MPISILVLEIACLTTLIYFQSPKEDNFCYFKITPVSSLSMDATYFLEKDYFGKNISIILFDSWFQYQQRVTRELGETWVRMLRAIVMTLAHGADDRMCTLLNKEGLPVY